MKKGLAIHCHHAILLEYCYDYQERVDYIKSDKPKNEQKTRLKLFKLLPKEAEKDIPKYYLEAYRKRVEAYLKWEEADLKRGKKDAFHAKWCGCKEWNGKEIIFK